MDYDTKLINLALDAGELMLASGAETFRVGNIGEIYKEDILKLSEIMKAFLEEYNHE